MIKGSRELNQECSRWWLCLLTVSIQHFGDVKVLLSNIKGQVEVVHIIGLGGGGEVIGEVDED